MPFTRRNVIDGHKLIEAYRVAHAQLYAHDATRSSIPQEHTPLMDNLLSKMNEIGFVDLDEFRLANYEIVVKDMGFKSITDFELTASATQIDEFGKRPHL